MLIRVNPSRIADVHIAESEFKDCVVVESGEIVNGMVRWNARLYFAKGVGMVVQERRVRAEPSAAQPDAAKAPGHHSAPEAARVEKESS